MIRRLNCALVMLAALVAAGCVVPKEFNAAESAVADQSLTSALSLQPADVKIQAPCLIWFAASDRPAMYCVYVQTADTVYFLKYDENRKRYLPTTQLRFGEIDSVSLQRYGRNRQVQMSVDSQLFAFHMVHSIMVDRETTEAAYRALVDGGVAARPPVKWIDSPTPPLNQSITIPVYVGR